MEYRCRSPISHSPDWVRGQMMAGDRRSSRLSGRATDVIQRSYWWRPTRGSSSALLLIYISIKTDLVFSRHLDYRYVLSRFNAIYICIIWYTLSFTHFYHPCSVYLYFASCQQQCCFTVHYIRTYWVHNLNVSVRYTSDIAKNRYIGPTNGNFVWNPVYRISSRSIQTRMRVCIFDQLARLQSALAQPRWK